jgi:hypothetical protein
MSTQIRVDWHELLAVAGSIEAALGVGGEIVHSRGSLESAAAGAGRGDVTGAVSHFLDKWSYGVECVDKDAQTLAEFLKLAGEAYQRAETAIAQGAGA